MSELENVGPGSKMSHSNPALNAQNTPREGTASKEDTAVSLGASDDTAEHTADLNQAKMPAAPGKEGRFAQHSLRVTIQEHSLQLVLGSKASSIANKLVEHFSRHKDETTVTVNLRAHEKAFRLCVVKDDLSAERQVPEGPSLMGVVSFKRVGKNIYIDSLHDINGREVPPFSIIRNVVLAERAVEKTENKARQEVVHAAKFRIGLVENQFDMPGNADMQKPVQKMLGELDSAMSSLLTKESASSSAENPKAWAKEMQALQQDLDKGIATVCPCVDAFLLVFDPGSQSDQMRNLRDNAGLQSFLDSIMAVRLLDRSAEAGLKRTARPFVEKLRNQ